MSKLDKCDNCGKEGHQLCNKGWPKLSKLDELDKELEQEYDREWEDNFRDPFTQSLVFFKDFARKYYELGRLEEREVIKKLIEKLKGNHNWSADNKAGSYAAEAYDEAIEDILSELNKLTFNHYMPTPHSLDTLLAEVPDAHTLHELPNDSYLRVKELITQAYTLGFEEANKEIKEQGLFRVKAIWYVCGVSDNGCSFCSEICAEKERHIPPSLLS